MPNISYRFLGDGAEYGTWPGISVRLNGKITKRGQIYLGRVINKERGIFFSKERGFFRFDPTDQSFHEVSEDELKHFRPAALSILPSDYSTVRFGGGFRSKRQRRKGKIHSSECRVPENSKER